jgi:hypothetical protein
MTVQNFVLECHTKYSTRNLAACRKQVGSHIPEKSSLYENFPLDQIVSNY